MMQTCLQACFFLQHACTAVPGTERGCTFSGVLSCARLKPQLKSDFTQLTKKKQEVTERQRSA
ncbi:hypothetical protein PDJAM_G00240960 [Pangasius djambal]|uniref:Uncharacterized protein n=1 Tax=Pangasius djambal TaxID=1691987 RepID=A0ACC5YH60_9TELE|nr:hypothetical protein [Pangasius djambal]